MSALLRLAHVVPPELKPITKVLRRPVKYWLNSPLDLEVWELRLRLLPRGNLSEQKLFSAPQLFDREEFSHMRRVLQGEGVFIDVGANAGIYSFWATRCMRRQGQVIAVEPDPEMLRRFSFNIKTNGLDEIKIFPGALSDYEGTAQLNVNPLQRGLNSLDSIETEPNSGKQTSVHVNTTTLVKLVELYGLQNIDLLKLDIEGHEHQVLRHFFSNAPERLLPKVIISEFKQETFAAIQELTDRYGYIVRAKTKLNLILEQASRS